MKTPQPIIRCKNCNHLKNEHRISLDGMWDECDKFIHRTERLKFKDGYKKVQCHYQCTCSKFEPEEMK